MYTPIKVLVVFLTFCSISIADPSVYSNLFGTTPEQSKTGGSGTYHRLFGDIKSGNDKPGTVEPTPAEPTPTLEQPAKKPDGWQEMAPKPVEAIQPTGPPIPLENNLVLVLRDLETLHPGTRQFVRYLDLTAVYPQERPGLYAVCCTVLNSLSWSNALFRPTYVNGSDNRIIRFDIRWYCRNTDDANRWLATWNKMVKADVYYKIPWLNPSQAAVAKSYTGSDCCLLRADWFCFYAMLQDDPKTADEIEGYYSDFLGLPKTEAELLTALRVRLDESAKLGTDRRGLVVASGTDSDAVHVAFHNRRINRAPTVMSPYGGYFYYTQDFFNSKKARNVLNDPLDNDKDGGEYIWSLPNHMQGYYLAAKDQKQSGVFNQVSEVPIEIASSQFSHRRVKYNTCTHCHVHGINSYKDVFEDVLLKSGGEGNVILTETKQDTILRARQLFSSDIKGIVNADQLAYSTAIELVTGVKPSVFAGMWAHVFEQYEQHLTPERAAWEFGTTDIKSYLADKVISSTKGQLLLLIKADPKERSIDRGSFEEEFQNGKLLQSLKGPLSK